MAGRDDTNWEILAGLRFALACIVICGHVTFYFADEAAPRHPDGFEPIWATCPIRSTSCISRP